jgi:hypothetical protein
MNSPRYLVTEAYNGTTRYLSPSSAGNMVTSTPGVPILQDAVERVLAARAWYWGKAQRHRVIALGLGFEVWAGQTIIAEIKSEVKHE